MSLTKSQTELIREILTVIRRNRKRVKDVAIDERDLEEVLQSLHTAGYLIVPRGYLASLRRLLDKVLSESDAIKAARVAARMADKADKVLDEIEQKE